VSTEVYAICEDRYGNLWFGTRNGVSRYDGFGWRTYSEDDGLVDD
jgi:ligand-binding sensor domain-containing protein